MALACSLYIHQWRRPNIFPQKLLKTIWDYCHRCRCEYNRKWKFFLFANRHSLLLSQHNLITSPPDTLDLFKIRKIEIPDDMTANIILWHYLLYHVCVWVFVCFLLNKFKLQSIKSYFQVGELNMCIQNFLMVVKFLSKFSSEWICFSLDWLNWQFLMHDKHLSHSKNAMIFYWESNKQNFQSKVSISFIYIKHTC